MAGESFGERISGEKFYFGQNVKTWFKKFIVCDSQDSVCDGQVFILLAG